MGSTPPGSPSSRDAHFPINNNPSASKEIQKSSWIYALTNNEASPKSFAPDVEIIDGVACATVPEEVLKHPQPLWSNYVVGFFMGDAPHIGKVHATVNRIWTTGDKKMKVEVQFLNPKTVLFRIEDNGMRSRVLKGQFWHIGEIPMVVQEWSPKTSNLRPDLSSMPIWVDFQRVPDHLFTEVGLRFLGDIIGAYVKLYPNTARCTKLDIARVLVVANLDKPLPTSLKLNAPEEVTIEVSYPWLPPHCNTCNTWGHKDSECAQMKMGAIVTQNPEDEKLSSKEKTKETRMSSSTHLNVSGQSSLPETHGVGQRVSMQEETVRTDHQ